MRSDIIRAGCRILGMLGAGPISTSYRASSPEHGPVALKVIRPGRCPSASQEMIWKSQSWVLARLGHPHVVAGFGTARDEGDLLWIEELLAPAHLGIRLRDGPLAVPDAVALLRDLALALHAAHDADVHHGALAPSSVLFNPEGVPRLGDWGFPLLELAGPEVAGRPAAAWRWAAPERRDEPPSAPADMYSLGRLLVDALCGGSTPDPQGALGAALAGRPQLAEALAGLLDADPAARPTALEVARACAASLREDISDAGPTTVHPPAPESLGRTRALPSARSKVPGRDSSGELPKFSVQSRLGSGGMGQVWAAIDADLRRRVAIKSALSGEEQVQRQFIAEAQVTGQLEHPNIVPIHELALDDEGRAFIVMKKVEGSSLHALLYRLKRGPRPAAMQLAEAPELSAPGPKRGSRQEQLAELSWLLGVFLKVCDGVSYAHSRGVIHRDLKPSNVMVGAFGEVLVLDWGLAQVHADPTATDQVVTERSLAGPEPVAEGTLVGTPAYMAPEQARGELSSLDERADVYALGAILYQIVSLETARPRAPRDAYTAALSGQVVPPSRRAPGRFVPSELEAVVLRAMRPDRDERYPTVQALRADVQAFLDGRVVEAHRYTLVERALRWTRRHRTTVRVAALVALLLVLGVFGALWAAEEARLAGLREQAERRASRLDTLRGQLEELQSELLSLPSLAPEEAGAQLAAFAQLHAARIGGIAGDDELRSARPPIAAAAERLPQLAESLRVRTLQRWAWTRLAALPAPAEADSLSLRAAEDDFQRFRDFLAGLPDSATLPVAEFATWRARAADVREDVRGAAAWVSRAYCAQPRSEAAGRGFLSLAEGSLRDGLYERASDQFLRALSTFGPDFPVLRAGAWYGLARALARLPDGATNPFGLDQPPRLLALRCLLQVVDSQGSPRPALLEALGEDSGAARLWLEVLRRTSLEAGEGLLADLAPTPGYEGIARLRGDTLEVFDCGPPLRAGAGPVSLRRRLAWSLELARYELGVPPGAQLAWVGRLGEGNVGAAIRFNRPGPRGERLLLVSQLGQRPVWRAVVLPEAQTPHMRDVDGDGQLDAVLWTNQLAGSGEDFVQVALCDERGNFGPPFPARPRAGMPAALRPGRMLRSFVNSAESADLDGDGRPELVLSLGAFNHFCVEVWRIERVRGPRLLARRIVGSTRLIPVLHEGELRIAIDPGLGRDHLPFFTVQNLEPPPLRPALLRLRADSLVLEPWPEPLAEREVLAGHAQPGPFADGELLVLRDARRSHWRMGGQVVTLPRHIGQLGPRWCRYANLYRRADADDLAVLAARPPAVPLPRQDQSEILTLVRFLLDFGLPSEAARVATEALAAGVPARDVGEELARLVLAGLTAAGAPRPLLAHLRSCAPNPRLVAGLESAVRELAWAGTAIEQLATVVSRWAKAAALEAGQRAALAGLHEAWSPLCADRPAVDWQGPIVSAGDGELPAHLLAGHPLTAARSGSGFSFINRRFPPMLSFEEEAPRAAPPLGCFGIPVRFGGGPWRVSFDLLPRCLDWSAGISVGLLPFEQLVRGSDLGMTGARLHCHGANDFDAVTLFALDRERKIGRAADLDPLLGRWLRISVEGLPDEGILRVVVADRERREVVAAFSARTRGPLRAGSYLLGIGGSDSTFWADGELGRVTAWGDFTPLDGGDFWLRSLYEARPTLAAISAGVRDSGDAAWSALARRCAELEADVRDPQLLNALHHSLATYTLQAAWLAADGDAEAFVAATGALDARHTGLLVQWLLFRPGPTSTPELWRAAGTLCERWLTPGWSDEDRTRRLIDHIQTLELDPSDVLAATALRERGAVPARLERELLAALIIRARSDFAAALAVRLLTLHRSLPDLEDAPIPRAVALWILHRRAEGIAALDGVAVPPILQRRLDDQRALLEERAASLERERASAADRGVLFPLLPDEDL